MEGFRTGERLGLRRRSMYVLMEEVRGLPVSKRVCCSAYRAKNVDEVRLAGPVDPQGMRCNYAR